MNENHKPTSTHDEDTEKIYVDEEFETLNAVPEVIEKMKELIMEEYGSLEIDITRDDFYWWSLLACNKVHEAEIETTAWAQQQPFTSY